MGELGISYILVKKPEGRRPLRRPKHIWEDNIRMCRSSKGDSREGQVMKTPVEGRVKKADPSSRQGRPIMISTL
jgi:hypothetical protein